MIYLKGSCLFASRTAKAEYLQVLLNWPGEPANTGNEAADIKFTECYNRTVDTQEINFKFKGFK